MIFFVSVRTTFVIGVFVNGVFRKLLDERKPEYVNEQSQHHAHARSAKTPVVSEPGCFLQSTADDRRQERAEVDSHVEDRVRTVTSRVVLRIKATDLYGHVGFEETIAHDEETKGRIEDPDVFKGHQEVTNRHEDGPDDNGHPVAQITVRKETAEQRREVDQRGVPFVDLGGVGLGPLEEVDHVEDQQGPHPVITEALPHFGEEENVKPDGMSEKGPLLSRHALSPL